MVHVRGTGVWHPLHHGGPHAHDTCQFVIEGDVDTVNHSNESSARLCGFCQKPKKVHRTTVNFTFVAYTFKEARHGGKGLM